jgi:CheY-like chemotaxis protein
MKILYVEDEPAYVFAFRKVFEPRGHQITDIRSGDEALTHFKEHQDYDLTVCDGQLPGLSGRELIIEIRKFSDIPIVACSNMYNSEMIRAGANSYIEDKQFRNGLYDVYEDRTKMIEEDFQRLIDDRKKL